MKQAFAIAFSLICAVSCGPRSTVHPAQNNGVHSTQATQHVVQHNVGKTIVPMRREGGVCYVMVKINGVEMEVIFDTGATDVVISMLEAVFLVKQGKLTEDDIIGTEFYQVADGSISSGTVVLLRSVQIGSKVLSNVRATVVDNMDAPLLLGQSALDRFDHVSIDYTNSCIIIE